MRRYWSVILLGTRGVAGKLAALLAILVFEQPLVGQVLCGLTCLQSLLCTVFYWHYDKVY